MSIRTYLVALLLSGVIAAIITPQIRKLALRHGVVDLPDKRRVHTRPIPRLGGIGIAIAFYAPILGLFFWDNRISRALIEDTGLLIGMFAGGGAMLLLGVVDDFYGVRARYKLVVQLVVAVFIYFLGLQVGSIYIPFVGQFQMGILALPITILWIVGIVNAINLLDGLDGLAAGVVFFVCATNFVICLTNNNILVCLITAALGGAIIGFLLWNFNPARIFMGDSGSLFLGLMIATTSLIGNKQKGSTAIAILVPIVALGVPIVDTLFAMVRRALEQRPIFSADRGHIHHKLIEMGLTQRRAVLIIYSATVVLTISAVFIYIGRGIQTGIGLAVAFVIFFGIVRTLGIHRQLAARNGKHCSFPPIAESLFTNVPETLRELEGARTTGDVESILEQFAESSGAEGISFVLSHGEQPYEFEWHRVLDAESTNSTRRELVSTMVWDKDLDADGSRFTIEWYDSGQYLPVQGKVLLRLVGNVAARQVIDLEGSRRDGLIQDFSD